MQLWLPSLDSKVLLVVSMKVNTLNLGWGDLSQSPIRITLLFFWATYYDIRLLFFPVRNIIEGNFADAPNFRFKGRPQHQELHMFPTLYDNCVCSFISHNQLSEAVEPTSCQNMKSKDAIWQIITCVSEQHNQVSI